MENNKEEIKTQETIFNYEDYPKTMAYDPFKLNMFIVKFDKSTNIAPWYVKKTTLPEFIDGKWSDITIKFFNMIQDEKSSGRVIFDFFKKYENKNFSFFIEFLGPTGKTTQKWEILCDGIKQFGFTDLAVYDSEKNSYFELTVKVKKCVLHY